MGLESESGEVTIPVEESTGEIKIANPNRNIKPNKIPEIFLFIIHPYCSFDFLFLS